MAGCAEPVEPAALSATDDLRLTGRESGSESEIDEALVRPEGASGIGRDVRRNPFVNRRIKPCTFNSWGKNLPLPYRAAALLDVVLPTTPEGGMSADCTPAIRDAWLLSVLPGKAEEVLEALALTTDAVEPLVVAVAAPPATLAPAVDSAAVATVAAALASTAAVVLGVAAALAGKAAPPSLSTAATETATITAPMAAAIQGKLPPLLDSSGPTSSWRMRVRLLVLEAKWPVGSCRAMGLPRQ